jgi:hypothetical protein
MLPHILLLLSLFSFVYPTTNPFQCSKEETGCYDLPLEIAVESVTKSDLPVEPISTTIPSTTIESPPTPIPSNNIHGASVTKKSNRFNHANFDCGSLILATNKEAEGATNILVKSKDKYLLNQCRHSSCN